MRLVHAVAMMLAFSFTYVGAAKQPNIILVMPDDAGYGDYACLGNPVMRTPAVDAFKKQSLLFTRPKIRSSLAKSPLWQRFRAAGS